MAQMGAARLLIDSTMARTGRGHAVPTSSSASLAYVHTLSILGRSACPVWGVAFSYLPASLRSAYPEAAGGSRLSDWRFAASRVTLDELHELERSLELVWR